MESYCLKDIVWAYDKKKGQIVLPLLLDDNKSEITIITTNKKFKVDKLKYNSVLEFSTIKEILIKSGIKIDSVIDTAYAFIRYKSLLPANLRKDFTYNNQSYEKFDKIFANKFLTKKEVKKLTLKIKDCINAKIHKVEMEKKLKNNRKIMDGKDY